MLFHSSWCNHRKLDSLKLPSRFQGKVERDIWVCVRKRYRKNANITTFPPGKVDWKTPIISDVTVSLREHSNFVEVSVRAEIFSSLNCLKVLYENKEEKKK